MKIPGNNEKSVKLVIYGDSVGHQPAKSLFLFNNNPKKGPKANRAETRDGLTTPRVTTTAFAHAFIKATSLL